MRRAFFQAIWAWVAKMMAQKATTDVVLMAHNGAKHDFLWLKHKSREAGAIMPGSYLWIDTLRLADVAELLGSHALVGLSAKTPASAGHMLVAGAGLPCADHG